MLATTPSTTTNPLEVGVTRVDLGNFPRAESVREAESQRQSLCARVFGELVARSRAFGHEGYLSDLYYDAKTLDEIIEIDRSSSFSWSVRPSGTSMGLVPADLPPSDHPTWDVGVVLEERSYGTAWRAWFVRVNSDKGDLA